MKKILSIIPARSNSKGVKNKNVIDIGGKPLMAYTIECSKKSKYVNRTIVSTDSLEYKKIAEKYGAEVPFLRDSKFAKDEVHAIYPVIELIEKLKKVESYEPDLVLMLLPTSPLRKSETLDLAIEKFLDLKSKYKSLVSVKALKKSKYHIRKIERENLKPLVKTKNYNIQRQNLEDLFILNGSIYISTPSDLLSKKTFHIENFTTFYEMDEIESIDVDSIQEVNYVRKLINIL